MIAKKWMEDESMKKVAGIVLCCLLALNLAGTGWCVARLYGKENDRVQQYVMYIGTNDKDTNTMLFSEKECMEIVDSICLKYLDGYTVVPTSGRWRNEKGILESEYTIMCYFEDAQADVIFSIADEVISALNQNCVLIVCDDVKSEYYYGR